MLSFDTPSSRPTYNLPFYLLSPSGSGKGTYGALLASRFLNATFLSVGDILREQSATNESLGAVMRKGALVDDSLVNDAVTQHLENRAAPKLKNAGMKDVIILDGFPRNALQSSLLEKWPDSLRPSLAIQVDVPDDICIIKLLGRRKCSICNGSFNLNGVDTGGFDMPAILPKAGVCKVNCNPDVDWEKRDDDTADTIKSRMGVYHNETKPLLRFWKKRGQLLRFLPLKGVNDMDELLARVETQFE